MCSTVKDLLALPELRECYLLNPGVSCKQTVKSVTIMDNPNILKWLSGYEVLLSNGYSLVNFQNREWKQFIAGLVKKNVAALFIKLSYFVDQLPEETIRYTVEQDFPVVVVPNHYSWTTISDPVQQYIIEQQYYYFKETIRLRDYMNDILIHGGNLRDLCTAAAEELRLPLAVFDERWRFLGGTVHPEWVTVRKLLETKSPRCNAALHAADPEKYPHYRMDTPCGQVVFIKLSGHLQLKYLAILLQEEGQTFNFKNTYLIDQISIVMMLYFYKEVELSRLEKHYYTNFLLDLIDGVLTDKKEILEKAARLDRKVYATYQLIICEFSSEVPQTLIDDLLPLFKREQNLIRNIMICERERRVIFFHPVVIEENRISVEKLCTLIHNYSGQPAMQFGVSRSYAVEKLHCAYNEALFALSVQRFARRKIIYYEDLSLLRLFEANSRKADMVFMTEFFNKTIRSLTDYDTENSIQLIDTLEAYLKNDLSIALTAQALYIHENTLRARIKRIEKITRRSLKSPMDIAELIIGLQIYRLTYPD